MTSERFVCYGAARNNVLATLLTIAHAVKHLSVASVMTDRPAIEHRNPLTSTCTKLYCLVLAYTCIVCEKPWSTESLLDSSGPAVEPITSCAIKKFV